MCEKKVEKSRIMRTAYNRGMVGKNSKTHGGGKFMNLSGRGAEDDENHEDGEKAKDRRLKRKEEEKRKGPQRTYWGIPGTTRGGGAQYDGGKESKNIGSEGGRI